MELREKEERRRALEEEVEQLKKEKVLLEKKVQELTGRSSTSTQVSPFLHSQKYVDISGHVTE